MIYLVSFSQKDMVYSRHCGSQYDAAKTMFEANKFCSEEFYINACKNASRVLAESGQKMHTVRILSNIVLTVIEP